MTLRVLLLDDSFEAGKLSCETLAQLLYERVADGREAGKPGFARLPELPGNSDRTPVRVLARSATLEELERACRERSDHPLEFVIVDPLSDTPDVVKSRAIIDSGWHRLFDFILVDLNWSKTFGNSAGQAVFISLLEREPRNAVWCRQHCGYFTADPRSPETTAGQLEANSALHVFSRDEAGHERCSKHLLEAVWLPKCRSLADLKLHSLPREMSRAFNSGPSSVAFHDFPNGRKYFDGRSMTYDRQDPASRHAVVAGTRKRLEHFHDWMADRAGSLPLLQRERDRARKLRELFDVHGSQPQTLTQHEWPLEGRPQPLVGLTKVRDHFFRLNLCGGIDDNGEPHACECEPDDPAGSFDLINHLAHVARAKHGVRAFATKEGTPQVFVPRQEFVQLLRDFVGSPKQHAGATEVRFEARARTRDEWTGVQKVDLALRWNGTPIGSTRDVLERLHTDDVGSLQPLIQDPWPRLVYDLFLATRAEDQSPLLLYRDGNRWTCVEDRAADGPDHRRLLTDDISNALVFVIETLGGEA